MSRPAPSPESGWAISDRVAFVEGGGRVVALHLDRLADAPLVMEGTAAAIWLELLDDGAHPRRAVREDDMISSLAVGYDTAPEAIAHDVSSFLEQMRESGFLVRAPTSGPESGERG